MSMEALECETSALLEGYAAQACMSQETTLVPGSQINVFKLSDTEELLLFSTAAVYCEIKIILKFIIHCPNKENCSLAMEVIYDPNFGFQCLHNNLS